MTFQLLEQVVLRRDIPEHSLKAGDLGTIVHLYDGGDLEVEFMTASGHTVALLTLQRGDVRSPERDDVFAVRPRAATATR